MKYNIGQFLLCKTSAFTAIAVVKEYFGKEDYYVLQVINSQGTTYEVEMYSWEFEKDGWKTFMNLKVGASPVNEEKTLTPIEVQDLLNAISKTVVAGNGYRGGLSQYEQS